MRQVFSSVRLENVEAVAELLRAQGIAVKITQGRSYRGKRRTYFSYREQDQTGPQPAVWIVRAEDQPRGRQLLREAGLLDSTRAGESSFLPVTPMGPAVGGLGRGGPMRAKLTLLGLIALVVGLIAFGVHKHDQGEAAAAAAAAARPAPPALVPQAVDLQAYRADVPSALARLLVQDTLAARAPAAACLDVDGQAPATPLLEGLQATARILPGPDCDAADALAISVRDYTTDGSGRGSVSVVVAGGEPRVLEVERDGSQWRVLGAR
jgi:hypothetical protein